MLVEKIVLEPLQLLGQTLNVISKCPVSVDMTQQMDWMFLHVVKITATVTERSARRERSLNGRRRRQKESGSLTEKRASPRGKTPSQVGRRTRRSRSGLQNVARRKLPTRRRRMKGRQKMDSPNPRRKVNDHGRQTVSLKGAKLNVVRQIERQNALERVEPPTRQRGTRKNGLLTKKQLPRE
jgi:hypothetical protein